MNETKCECAREQIMVEAFSELSTFHLTKTKQRRTIFTKVTGSFLQFG